MHNGDMHGGSSAASAGAGETEAQAADTASSRSSSRAAAAAQAEAAEAADALASQFSPSKIEVLGRPIVVDGSLGRVDSVADVVFVVVHSCWHHEAQIIVEVDRALEVELLFGLVQASVDEVAVSVLLPERGHCGPVLRLKVYGGEAAVLVQGHGAAPARRRSGWR